MRADLHIHTLYSDGKNTPEEIIAFAKSRNIDVISITDHDTVDALPIAKKCADENNILFINGIELSTYIENKQIHILGYGFSCNNTYLSDILNRQRERRHERNKLIIEKLNQLGVDINYDEILNFAQGKSVGRKHIAEVLIKKGICENLQDAFNRYLNEEAPAFVSGERITPYEGIEILNKAGAATVLAHPCKIKMPLSELKKLISKFKKCGLIGIEAEYFAQTIRKRTQMITLAKENNLIITGGSDYHGDSLGAEVYAYDYQINDNTLKILTDGVKF